MSESVAIISKTNIDNAKATFIAKTINLSTNCEYLNKINGKKIFAVSYPNNTPLKGPRLYNDQDWTVLFAGDIIEYGSVPFADIIKNIANRNYSFFVRFNGIFSITAFHKQTKTIYGVSDRRSQKPFYYYHNNSMFCLSNVMSSFCRLPNIKIGFNEEWLWEFFYFNFPIGETTFLSGVKRVPPASVIKYCLFTNKIKIFEYAKLFVQKDKLLDGEEALEYAAEIFEKKIPKYYQGADDIACALTGGWDGRTMLAFAPEREKVTAYTYGSPGCSDLFSAAKIAKKIKQKHVQILLDESFLTNLPLKLFETVYLSSGLQNIARATLLHVYEQLTQFGKKFPLTVSGISLGTQFRGHAATPFLISDQMAHLYKHGKQDTRPSFWSALFDTNYELFINYIKTKLKNLQELFGDYQSSNHHLTYNLYAISTSYFCGELNISAPFTTVRVPSWDQDIIDLSYSVKQSTLTFSQFSDHARGDKEEMVLQAYLLSRFAPYLTKIPIRNVRPVSVFKKNHSYKALKFFTGGINKAFHPAKRASLENWSQWLNETHSSFIDQIIFSKDAEIRNYIKDSFIAEIKSKQNTYYIAKLMTAEIILKLINNRWQKFW